MKLYEEIAINGSYCHRRLSRDQAKDVKAKLKELQDMEKQIETLQKQLGKKMAAYENDIFYNSVFTDKPGFTYDVRHYVLTGKTDLI